MSLRPDVIGPHSRPFGTRVPLIPYDFSAWRHRRITPLASSSEEPDAGSVRRDSLCSPAIVRAPCRCPPLGQPPARPPYLALWLRGRRSGTRTYGMRWFTRRVVVATTGGRDAQAERIKAFFDAQAHGGVLDVSLRFGLPPLALHAQTPIGCCHNSLPFQGWKFPRNALSGSLLAIMEFPTVLATVQRLCPTYRRGSACSGLSLRHELGSLAVNEGMRGKCAWKGKAEKRVAPASIYIKMNRASWNGYQFDLSRSFASLLLPLPEHPFPDATRRSPHRHIRYCDPAQAHTAQQACALPSPRRSHTPPRIAAGPTGAQIMDH